MDRRAKKLEKKRKDREQAKKKANALAAKRPSAEALLIRSAARQEFGPCFVSPTWDEPDGTPLVSVVVTRKLPSGQFLPALALVDRTCLGVKDAFVADPMFEEELDEFVERVGSLQGGMDSCSPLVAQSIVYHAIDYAAELGFAAHPDFADALFGPRPAELLDLAGSRPDKPIFIAGPDDNVAAITSHLRNALGADGFAHIDPTTIIDAEPEPDGLDADEPPPVHSVLDRE